MDTKKTSSKKVKPAKKSPEFEKNKGKISQFCTHEARVAGGKASQAVQKKKNAMREALKLAMSMKAPERRAKHIRNKYPELSDVEIDGFIEAAVLLRDQAHEDYRATVKLIEIMGGSLAKEEDEKQGAGAGILKIVVATPEDAKAIESL